MSHTQTHMEGALRKFGCWSQLLCSADPKKTSEIEKKKMDPNIKKGVTFNTPNSAQSRFLKVNSDILSRSNLCLETLCEPKKCAENTPNSSQSRFLKINSDILSSNLCLETLSNSSPTVCEPKNNPPFSRSSTGTSTISSTTSSADLWTTTKTKLTLCPTFGDLPALNSREESELKLKQTREVCEAKIEAAKHEAEAICLGAKRGQEGLTYDSTSGTVRSTSESISEVGSRRHRVTESLKRPLKKIILKAKRVQGGLTDGSPIVSPSESIPTDGVSTTTSASESIPCDGCTITSPSAWSIPTDGVSTITSPSESIPEVCSRRHRVTQSLKRPVKKAKCLLRALIKEAQGARESE